MSDKNPKKDTRLSIILKVCKALEDDEARSLREACRIADIPRSTFLGWLDNAKILGIDELTIDRYARAIGTIIDRYDDEIETLAMGLHRSTDGKMRQVDDAANVARDKLAIDTKKWLRAKAMPKKTAEKLKHEVGGADDKPIEHSIKVEFVEATDTQ